MKIARKTALAALLNLLIAGALLGSDAERVMLEKAVVTHNDIVRISDFLPENVSQQIRLRAADVVVGDSPAPGARRTFDRAEVAYALRATPQLRASVEVPAAIEVTRWSRPLSNGEILAAISGSSGAIQFSGLQSLTLEDIGIHPTILVTETVARIEITRMEQDLTRSETRIRMWIPSEPRISPFWIALRRAMVPRPVLIASGISKNEPTGAASRTVRADVAPDSVTSAFVGGLARPVVGPVAVEAPLIPEIVSLDAVLDPVVLIRAGKPVQLVMQATSIRITTLATALEIGRKGQKIRVRSGSTGKVLLATVMNAETVEVDY